MRKYKWFLSVFLITLSIFIGMESFAMPADNTDSKISQESDLKSKDESFWKEKLSPEVYHIAREKGTEKPFSGKYYHEKEPGKYYCSSCGAPLFSSDTKFDSGSGWPSFYDALDPNAVELKTDTTHGMVRTEVICKHCGAHLGHLFKDGPTPTGQRFCINSASLVHEKDMPK